MNIVILSGGSGKRLWPLSNEIRSKQFLKLFKKQEAGENGDEYESMVERIYRGIKEAMPDATITIATGKSQVSAIKNQLGDNVSVCVEPARRDTFPAIALAASYLKDELSVKEDDPVVVCPVDPFVEKGYFETIKRMGDAVSFGSSNIYLMGIKPSYPSEKYGYILTDDSGAVTGFREKPDLPTAEKYLAEGALWNGGVFAFKLGYILKKAHSLIDFSDYRDLKAKYPEVTKISFDYAVVEKEEKISALIFDGTWKDLGTWNTLTEAMETTSIGKVLMDDSCENTHIINELNIPVLGIGLKDMVVAASADGILVSDKHGSSYMKPLVETLDEPVKYAEKSWGSYEVIDVEKESLTIKVTLLPGHKMNYHSHEHRDEVWTVIEGCGSVIINGGATNVGPGYVVKIPAGTKHTVIARTKLVLMETQLGSEINVADKIKYDM